MPKPILKKTENKTRKENNLSAASRNENNQRNSQQDKMKLDRLLRKQRSKEYMEAIHSLDAGGHVHNHNKVDEIINIIKSEFPDVDMEKLLLGCVAVCYLGRPYEVHTLDTMSGIIDHYKTGQPLPGRLEMARGLVLRGGYEFVEVYVDCCRAVSANGVVSVIPG